MNNLKLITILFASTLLVACGGGGGSSGGTPTPSSSAVSSVINSSSMSTTAESSSSLSSSIVASSSSAESMSSADDSSTPASSSSQSSAAESSAAESSVAESSAAESSAAESSASSASSVGALTISGFIVVDQFGYLPDAKKIAVIRDPQTGFDAAQSFTPGPTYKLVNVDSGETVHSAAPVAWNAGATAAIAGDRAWWFDFSTVTTPGTYAVVDEHNNARSPDVRIGADVYNLVLRHAVRTFFYQRAGFAKEQPYAEAAWVDGASHIGPGQDTQARLIIDPDNPATERDLSGGWYDAGDFNKYTNWHADYLISLLHAYIENPDVWTDDFNIPESGNGIPDLIDEIKWGFDWLIKMQNENGSVLSVMGLAHADGDNPVAPSAVTGRSYYGPASTSATLTSATAFAFGSKVLATLGNQDLQTYAENLRTRAELAWDWADANPAVSFFNRPNNIAAGEQEVDDEARAAKKLAAAIYLFDATGDTSYRNLVDAGAAPIYWVDPWAEGRATNFLYYASLPGATPSIATNLRTTYTTTMNGEYNLTAIRDNIDPYRAYIGEANFTWGSNRTMSKKGNTFYNLITFDLVADATEASNAALGYLNYLHGMNPLSMAYLSNMYSAGAHSSVNEFYHSWFADKSQLWDRVGVSTYGPAPGFLVGGPNPEYDWDDNCTSNNPNAGCGSAPLSPPKGQPAMKSYLDFNTSWPLNSWEITENHNDYQVAYIRLLSKFVD